MAKQSDEAVERAGRARAESRVAFVVADRWRKALRQVSSDHLRAAEVLCLVHSLELGLKAFALFEAGRAPQGRDLSKLLRALSPDLQSSIIADARYPADRFEADLQRVHDVLKKRRSVRAYDAHLLDADRRFLQRFARAVQRALYGHASAARKPEANPSPGTPEDGRMRRENSAKLACSFCGKGQREVRKLISGPAVFICDECVRLCNDILAEEIAGAKKRVGALEVHAKTLASSALELAEACDQAVELPRPVAERARALAEEIGVVIAAGADGRVVLAEYANSVAVTARHFAQACDAVELPHRLAERARSLASEIEAVLEPPRQDPR